jgi:hypothetical protein
MMGEVSWDPKRRRSWASYYSILWSWSGREGEKRTHHECFIPYKKCIFPHHIPHSVEGKRRGGGTEETIKPNKICMATEKKTIWPKYYQRNGKIHFQGTSSKTFGGKGLRKYITCKDVFFSLSQPL